MTKRNVPPKVLFLFVSLTRNIQIGKRIEYKRRKLKPNIGLKAKAPRHFKTDRDLVF